MTISDRQNNFQIDSAVKRSKTIKSIIIEKGALKYIPPLLDQYFNNRSIFLVADENTMTAAGYRLEKELTSHAVEISTHVFPAQPQVKSSIKNAEVLLEKLGTSSAVPIALGSGVISDLVKYAAFQRNTPYMCIATAASMDGYASAGSPLSQDGFKHTISCSPPTVIVADLDIISSAPKEMAGWGYGDLAGKIPAGADWIIADTFNIEEIDEVAWPLVQNNLKSWIDDPAGVAAGDTGAINHLFTGLVLSSIAMEFHNSSRPASGADHQIAHMWEMDNLKHDGKLVSHGTSVALGTLTILSLYKWLLKQDFADLNIHKIVQNRRRLPDLENEINSYFTSSVIAHRALQEVKAKYIDDMELEKRLELIKRTWPILHKRLNEFLAPYDTIKVMLQKAGVETNPTAVSVNREYHKRTLVASRLIRRRYTILDFLEETGCFDQAVQSIFSQDGCW